MDDALVQDVVDAVADGDDVDWRAVTRRAAADTRARCGHLETLSRIGRHARGESPVLGTAARESPGVAVLMALALGHIAVGLAGAMAYRSYTIANAWRLLTMLAFGGMGVLLRRDRQNARARDLGAVFVLRSLSFARSAFVLVVHAWIAAPALASVLHTGLALDAWTPFFVWRFARRFPDTTRFAAVDRAVVVITRLVFLVGTVLFIANAVQVLGVVAPTTRIFTLLDTRGPTYSAALYVLMLPALAVIYLRSRAAPGDERTRVRLFGAALAFGLAPTAVQVILEALSPSYHVYLLTHPDAVDLMVTVVLLPLSAFPLITGYLVLVHRMFDVRIAVREGLRYLLARHTLRILTVTPFAFLAWHVYERRAESVASLMAGRATGLAALSAAGAALLVNRHGLLRWLDWYFDRADTDRTSMLARIGNDLRMARTRAELMTSVTTTVERALSTSATVLFHDERHAAYVPLGAAGAPLPASSALVSVLIDSDQCTFLDADESAGFGRCLPRHERLWLARADASALVPIRASQSGSPSALIVIGRRRDALGYSDDDRQFMATVASAAAIAFDNVRLKSASAGDDVADDFGAVCEACRRFAETADSRVCPCGGPLVLAAVPRRINGKFLVEGCLGQGGMGVAYLAFDMALNRRVAIKTLPSVSAAAMSRLAAEARTMAALSHHNLATIFEHQTWRGTPMLVCEYLQGGSLKDRLASQAALSPSQACDLVLALLDGLGYMHGQSVLHRDIKPSNIAFTATGTPKLLDFGLAALVERARDDEGRPQGTDTASTLAGTVAYLPPEAFAMAAPTPYFDLWGLAVVLAESVTGIHPFLAGADTVANICQGTCVPRWRRAADDAGVHTIFTEMLTTGRHQHLASVDRLRATVQAVRQQVSH